MSTFDSTVPMAATEVTTANSATVQRSLAEKIGDVVLKVILIGVGLAVGSVLGFVIALFIGLIDFNC